MKTKKTSKLTECKVIDRRDGTILATFLYTQMAKQFLPTLFEMWEGVNEIVLVGPNGYSELINRG